MKTQKNGSNSASTSSSDGKPTETKPTTPPRDPLKALGAALKAEREGQQQQNSGGDGENQDKGQKPKAKSKPKTLKALAEMLELEEADLYDVEVPAVAEGAEALSFGKLKDLATEHGNYTVRSAKLELDRQTFEAQRTATEAEFRAMLAALPADAIKPEAMQRLRATLADRHSLEKKRTLERIGEWSDANVMTADLKGMVAHMGEYDLPESFLLTHMDHRLVRLIRDSWKNAAMIKKALAEVTEEKPKTPAKSSSSEKPKGRAPAVAGNRKAQDVGNFMAHIHSAAQSRQG